MKKFNGLRPAPQRRRGAVTVLVAGSLVVLCGMAALAVDYGVMVATKNQLQRACDAAALAGLQYLPGSKSDAQTSAIFYAFQNDKVVVKGRNNVDAADDGDVENKNKISFPSNFRISVPAVRKVNFLFAPILPGNPKNGDVRARAIAAVQLRDRLNSPAVAPIGITPETYAAGLASGLSLNIRLIEQNKEGLGLNEMVAMDLRDGNNGKSPAQFEDQLRWDTSFNEPTYIGGRENTLNADDQAQSKATDDGVESRFVAANAMGDNGTKYGDIPYGSPRVVYMIITPSTPSGISGTNLALVQGFVPVYMETLTITKDGGTTLILLKARMLPPNYDTGIASAGGGYSDATTDSPTALRISRLVE